MSGIDQTASANKIFNGTSNVEIASANANITMSVNGTANVIVVDQNGANVTGYFLVSGNVSGGNITASNALSGANIYTGGQVSATGTIFAGNIDANGGNIGVGNVNTGRISAGGNIIANAGVYAGTVSAAGNVIGGNVTTAGLISAAGTAQLGNVQTVGIVSASGNVSGNYFIGNGSQLTGIDATRIINGSSNVAIPTANGNIQMAVNGTADVVVVTATGANVTGYANVSGNLSVGNAAVAGNVNSGNILTTGQVSATSNIITTQTFVGNALYGNTVSITSTAGGLNLSVTGNINVGNTYINNLSNPEQAQDAATKSYVDAIANGLQVKASSNTATTGNIFATTGQTYTYNNGTAGVGATITFGSVGNVTIDTVQLTAGMRVLIKNEPLVASIPAGTTPSAAYNGIYTVTTAGSPGAALVLTRATDDDTPAEMYAAYTFITSPIGADNNNSGFASTNTPTNPGPITVGTTFYIFTQFSSVAEYSGGNAIAINGTIISALYDGNTVGVNGSNQLYIPANAPLVTPNIGNATGSSLSVTGNVDAGNFNTGGLVTATGNVTGGNINTVGLVAGGNITSGGIVSAVGNIQGNNIIATTQVSAATVSASGTIQGGNIGTAGIVTATGNITGGNIATAGQISATGTATVGNVSTAGEVSATGNIVANPSSFFIGNGSQLTGVAASSVNAAALIGNTLSSNVLFSSLQTVGTLANLSVTGFASAGGDVTGANLLTGGNVSATGTLIGGNVTTAGSVSATGTVIGGNVTTAGNVSATGTVIGGNVTTAGSVSATGNVTGGNLLFGSGYVSGTGNIYANNIFANISGNIDAAGSNTEIQFNTTGDLLGANANFTYNYATNLFTVNGGNILAGNSNITGVTQAGNVTISGNDITGTNGIVTINGAGADVNFAVNGDTLANVFFVDAGTGTASFGSDAQTVNAIVAFNATNSILVPVGNTVQRPGTGVTGMLRFNTTNNTVEVYDNSAWTTVGQQTFTVIADEQFNGDGSTVQFTLGSTQTTSSVIVSINGVLQIPTTAYAVSGTYPTCVLTFTEAPQSGDVIDVREITTTTSVTSITFGNSSVTATGTTVDIKGNLNPTGNLLYSLGNNTNRWSNLYVGGNTIYLGNLQLKEASANTFAVYTADGVTEANIAVGNIDVTSIQSGTSSISITAPNGNAVLNAGGNNTLVVTSTGANITGYVNATGNITGSYLFGNGSQITGLPAGYSNTTAASFLAALGSNVISTTGTVTASQFIGAGNTLSNIQGANVTGTVSSATTATTAGTVTTAAQGNITSVGTLTSLNSGTISSSGNVTGANVLTGGLISATGNITGSYLFGNGSQITGLPAGYANSDVAAYLSSGTVSANILTTGRISATSTITSASTITGSTLLAGGISLTGNSITSTNTTITIDPNSAGGVDGAVIIAGNLSVQGNVTYIDSNVITTNEKSITLANNQSTGAALDGAGIDIGNANQYYWRYNNATTSWQANIGITPAANATLNLGGTSNYWSTVYATGASVSGNITAGNISATNHTGTTVSVTGNITGGNISATNHTGTTVSVTGNVTGASLVGTIATASQPTITSVGTLTSLNSGAISSSGNVTGANLLTGGLISATGNATAGNILTAGQLSAQGNITGGGYTNPPTTATVYGTALISYPNGSSNVTISGQTGSISADGYISAAGNVTGGNLSVGTGTITVGNIVNSNANGVGNIGSSTTYFNTVFAKATSAQYADLAENYVADAAHTPGTVVSFGGTHEVTKSAVDGDRRVAGVVSTNPSYIMNAGCTGEHVATVALTGRVPCRITGTVRKGDMMVSNGDGTARSEANPQVGSVIGKALENFDGQGEGMIEVVIGRF